jgi:uncharacterized protein (DUF1330 family)
MTAYLLFTRTATKDKAELELYSRMAEATLDGHPASALVHYGAQEILEGAAHEGFVILAFPNIAEAKAWYDSPSYRNAREHRFRGADYQVTLVEGM